MISRERILQRMNKLRAEREQLVANLHAYDGAIQDCEHWLGELDKEAAGETADDEQRNPVA